MKAIKHITAAVLCIVVLLSLCACNEPEGDEALILGSWEAEFDVTATLMELATGGDISLEDYYDFDGICFTARFTFNKDGTMEYGFDKESSKEAYDRFAAAYKEGMKRLCDEAYAEQYGSFDAFCEEMHTTPDIVLENYLNDLSTDMLFTAEEGRYKIEDGKVLLSSDSKTEPTGTTYWVYTELSDEKLYVSESYTAGVLSDNGSFPKTFVKVS